MCKTQFSQFFNNALRGLPRGNEVDGLPRGSSCKLWVDFWFIFLIIFWCRIYVHPDVTKYAREDDMLLKRGARGGRETKRLEQRSARLLARAGLT